MSNSENKENNKEVYDRVVEGTRQIVTGLTGLMNTSESPEAVARIAVGVLSLEAAQMVTKQALDQTKKIIEQAAADEAFGT